jgi:hypothetical protein
MLAVSKLADLPNTAETRRNLPNMLKSVENRRKLPKGPMSIDTPAAQCPRGDPNLVSAARA